MTLRSFICAFATALLIMWCAVIILFGLWFMRYADTANFKAYVVLCVLAVVGFGLAEIGRRTKPDWMSL